MTVRSVVRARFHWRWLVDSPLLVATLLAVVFGLAALREVAWSLRSADAVREQIGMAMARIAAEAAAVQLHAVDAGAEPTRFQIGKVVVSVHGTSDAWWLTSHLPGGQCSSFVCQRLSGAAPRALGLALAGPDPACMQSLGGELLPAGQLPRLDPQALAEAPRADQMAAFRGDRGVALLHWETGTERDDFVFDAARLRSGIGSSSEIVVVPGHLWVEARREACVVQLDRDVVVVVQGNLYLGSSVLVVGSGRLVFVTRPDAGAQPFADRDGNGRWSAGDLLRGATGFSGVVEGGGNVYLGLRGSCAPLVVEAGLVVGGELHLACAVRVDGAVVVPFGVTGIGVGLDSLQATGRRAFMVERERVPGFLTEGSPRPGLLRRSDPPAGAVAQQPLYVATPAR